MSNKKQKDSLGTRMKTFYESITRFFLTRRTYTMIRVDGMAFHTFTRGLVRPFDLRFIDCMDAAAIYLCQEISGAKCAFVQSDEITLVLTDFETFDTQAWFGGNLQKMCSASASKATSGFIRKYLQEFPEKGLTGRLPEFDSRVFQIPTRTEVINNFIWRQQDATRNSISSCAQSMFSDKELHGKNTNQQQEMMFQKEEFNWNNLSPKLKRGRLVKKVSLPNGRTEWQVVDPEVFTQDPSQLLEIIPENT